jgi:hypothetical protein
MSIHQFHLIVYIFISYTVGKINLTYKNICKFLEICNEVNNAKQNTSLSHVAMSQTFTYLYMYIKVMTTAEGKQKNRGLVCFYSIFNETVSNSHYIPLIDWVIANNELDR